MTKHDKRDAFDMTPIEEKHPDVMTPRTADDDDREEAAQKMKQDSGINEGAAGFGGGTQEKKRQGTEDAQKRSDTGTGL